MRAPLTLTAIIFLVLSPNDLSLANHSSNSSAANESATASSPPDEVLRSSVMGQKASEMDDVPTVVFCEMVKNPKLYFDKPVRVSATLQLATEASYLQDDKCVLSHDDQIGVRYVANNDKEQLLLNSEIRKVRNIEYGGRARVMVVGVLRNSSMRAFAWYRYRFDVNRVEGIAPVIVPYEGALQAGKTYRAAVRGDSDSGLSLAIPYRVRNDLFAVRVEWINLREFPALAALRSSSPEQWIVFTVVSYQSKQMTERRWNLTVECKILSVNQR